MQKLYRGYNYDLKKSELVIRVQAKRSQVLLLLGFFVFFLHLTPSLAGSSGRLTWVRLQLPQERRFLVLQVHADSFRVFVIYRTLTWTTGSLMCVCDHSYACIYTHRGWAHRQQVSTFLTQKNLLSFFGATDIWTWVTEYEIRRSTNLATPLFY